MCECVFVGKFCMWVIPTICFKLVLYEWCVIGRYKMVTYVTSTFSGFFLIMCPSCMSIILILLVIFNCMYRGFLDLVWLWRIICGLEHEFVSFNKPYLCFFFFYSWQNDADYEFAQFASKGSCFVWSSNFKYCLGFLVVVQ